MLAITPAPTEAIAEMTQAPGPLPAELLHVRQWLREVFQEAARGLPWPHQAGLLMIEQAIVTGMFGSLMVSAWMLEEARRTTDGPVLGDRFERTLHALEAVALGPLPAQVQQALRQLAGLPGGAEVLDRALGFVPGFEVRRPSGSANSELGTRNSQLYRR